jgi:hypothetical protein
MTAEQDVAGTMFAGVGEGVAMRGQSKRLGRKRPLVHVSVFVKRVLPHVCPCLTTSDVNIGPTCVNMGPCRHVSLKCQYGNVYDLGLDVSVFVPLYTSNSRW